MPDSRGHPALPAEHPSAETITKARVTTKALVSENSAWLRLGCSFGAADAADLKPEEFGVAPVLGEKRRSQRQVAVYCP